MVQKRNHGKKFANSGVMKLKCRNISGIIWTGWFPVKRNVSDSSQYCFYWRKQKVSVLCYNSSVQNRISALDHLGYVYCRTPMTRFLRNAHLLSVKKFYFLFVPQKTLVKNVMWCKNDAIFYHENFTIFALYHFDLFISRPEYNLNVTVMKMTWQL